MSNMLIRLLRDERAQATTEYVLIMAVLILASYGALRLFLSAWRLKFNHISCSRCTPFP